MRHIVFSLFLLLKIQVGGARWGNGQLIGVKGKGYTARALHQLLGLKEALEVPHLPDSSEDEDDSLGDGPPQDPLIGALTRQAEAFFTVLRGTVSKGLEWVGKHNLPLQGPSICVTHNSQTKCLWNTICNSIR